MTPQEEFQKMLIGSGLQAYHDAGFKGQGIRILNTESMNNNHGSGTGTVLQKCAPDASFYFGSTPTLIENNELVSFKYITDSGEEYDFAEYVKDNKIDIINCSQEHVTDLPSFVEYCEKLVNETGVVIFNCAGNKKASTSETLSHKFPTSCCTLVGAVDRNKKRLNYSSIGEQLDFVMFAGLIGGTSASSPFLAGTTACLFGRYGKMSPGETMKYLQGISIDLGTIGDDIYYGEGMPILKEPITIIMPVGSKTITVNGLPQEIDQPAAIDKVTGRTLAPVRCVAENLGALVFYDSKTKTIRIER